MASIIPPLPDTVANAMTQPYVVVTTLGNRESEKRSRKVIKGLGIAETALGIFCVIMGAVVVGFDQAYGYYCSCSFYEMTSHNAQSTGESMWCGVWILVAGALGVAAGDEHSPSCLVSTHLGFSVVGAVFSALLFSFGCALAATSTYEKTFFVGLIISIAIAAFISLVLLIISSSYCCYSNRTTSGGCVGCCDEVDQRNTVWLNTAHHSTIPGFPLNQHQTFVMNSSIPPANQQPVLISQQATNSGTPSYPQTTLHPHVILVQPAEGSDNNHLQHFRQPTVSQQIKTNRRQEINDSGVSTHPGIPIENSDADAEPPAYSPT